MSNDRFSGPAPGPQASRDHPSPEAGWKKTVKHNAPPRDKGGPGGRDSPDGSGVRKPDFWGVSSAGLCGAFVPPR